ncbi:MAG: hypothetical protein ABIH23_22440 [bacterium]
MKTAYELAMERLEKESPSSGKKMTADQKKRLGEVEDQGQAKIAERRIMAEKEIRDLQMQGKFEEIRKTQDDLATDIRKIEEEKEVKKNRIRQEEG